MLRVSAVAFLRGHETVRELKRLMQRSAEVRLAVAFWGQGATARLGIDQHRSGTRTKILCDLFSGACNPDEIIRLLEINAEIRTLDGLHAKVWCFDDSAVIGSSNASANGFGFEGKELAGNVEANVLVQDDELVGKVRNWFDDIWDKAEKVNEDRVEGIRLLWANRRNGRRRQGTLTLLGKLRSNPGAFKGRLVRILAYRDGGLSKEAIAAFDRLGRANYSSSQLDEYGDCPYYEDGTGWSPEPGTVFIDYHFLRRRGRPYFGQIWQVRAEGAFVPIDGKKRPDWYIILCDLLSDVDGLSFPPSEQKELGQMVRNHIEAHELWDADTPGNHHNLFDVSLHEFWAAKRRHA